MARVEEHWTVFDQLVTHEENKRENATRISSRRLDRFFSRSIWTPPPPCHLADGGLCFLCRSFAFFSNNDITSFRFQHFRLKISCVSDATCSSKNFQARSKRWTQTRVDSSFKSLGGNLFTTRLPTLSFSAKSNWTTWRCDIDTDKWPKNIVGKSSLELNMRWITRRGNHWSFSWISQEAITQNGNASPKKSVGRRNLLGMRLRSVDIGLPTVRLYSE